MLILIIIIIGIISFFNYKSMYDLIENNNTVISNNFSYNNFVHNGIDFFIFLLPLIGVLVLIAIKIFQKLPMPRDYDD